MSSHNLDSPAATNPPAAPRRFWRNLVWSGAAALLLVPLVAMQFTAEVVWSAGDFVIAAVLLFGSAGLFELAARPTRNRAYQRAAALAIVAALLLVWANLAVGIIGNEGNPANLMFFGVLGVGFVGGLLARFEAGGMAKAMVATAAAQTLAFLVALIAGWGFTLPITLVFVALWLGSAQMFREAARTS